MTAREELAAEVARLLRCAREVDINGHAMCGEHYYGWLSTGECPTQERVTDALLASPALARVIREKQAEALREAAGNWQWGAWTALTEPIKAHTGPARIMAAAQVVTDWLRARAEHHCCDDTCTEEH